MGVFGLFVKSPSTQSLLIKESEKTHSNRRCWQFCWHSCWHNSTPKIRAQSRHLTVRSTQQASADVVSVVFTRLCPRLWLLRATSRRQASMRMEAAWFRPEIPPRSYQFPVEFETHLN
jgi:hypothetical protein